MARERATQGNATASTSDAPRKRGNWWANMLAWREKHIPEKTFVVLLALIVGTAAGLAAEVTEWDVRLGLSEVAKFPSRDAAMERPGERYFELMRAFLEAKDAGLKLGGVAWWGLTDAYTWLTDFHGERNFPLLFDQDNKSKPAFRGVRRAFAPGHSISSDDANK